MPQTVLWYQSQIAQSQTNTSYLLLNEFTYVHIMVMNSYIIGAVPKNKQMNTIVSGRHCTINTNGYAVHS